ncbi:MAG: glycosyltransferase family 4 protein [Rhodospirillales bacterium]|nr:glycosyltransferase family 4 protein [Rhodospirillales bacterium]MDE2319161.1 glycosyltransferase family 4 protein [Rhodospirillales bacterium]
MNSETLSITHRLWRLLPARARRRGLEAVARVLAPCACSPSSSPSYGVAVGGELEATTGLGEAARILLAGVQALGFGGYPVTFGAGRAPRGYVPEAAALLLAVNAPSLPLMLARAKKTLVRRRVIGSWAWELPVVPESWAAGGRYVHEVWAPSPFVAQALEVILPERVRMVPYPLALCGLPPIEAAHGLDLPSQVTVTLMVLSLGSSFTRKNPLAGVEAFRRAFANRVDQRLILKLQGAAAYPREAAQIEAVASPNIQVISGVWPKARVTALMARADIILSLHRAEGFGLVLAEAMLRGKPVVATGWSGNMAFMDKSCAALIGYELVNVKDESSIYTPIPDARWAEPDVAHAAAWLRRLGNDAGLRLAMGSKARAHAAKALNGEAMRQALVANGVMPALP